ncbi:aminoglycoside phosphotransferase family protein [Allokutzneria sp. NRRL B-24872]|uniref:aminoglycoside phosphotransferase family protein n=1 Tax=Allokutzneria sp. NRRL B-24872 TaxID=1137961 RepID=UPI000A3BF45B|nr:aminoglycoside phosphotransferase family protein [Allokutzneria sp. NRRL B-24872]
MIEVPPGFVQSTVDREGDAGRKWTSALPEIVADLVSRWECVLDGAVMNGEVGVIVPVRRAGEALVLKVSFPHPGNVHEPDAFAAWGGCGAVLLHERDDAQFAMLLERAGSSSLADLADGPAIMASAGELHLRLTVPAPADLPRLAAQAEDWEDSLLRDSAELAHSLSARVVAAAVDTVRELGRAQPEVLVHGDFHARNVLRASREPWLAVDPKGHVGDPAYDGGTMLKTCAALGDASPLRLVDIFASAAELSRTRTRRWAQLHAVQTAFWGHRHGLGIPGLIAFAEDVSEVLT